LKVNPARERKTESEVPCGGKDDEGTLSPTMGKLKEGKRATS